ncbi:hypothetical protein JCM10213_003048 [Rhodosporidiobolus nylandii]
MTAAASSSAPTEAPQRAALLSTSPASLPASLDTASSLLHADLPVAFPTETVYGLGASALSSVAVKRIFAAKGRPSDNPLIVHVGGREMLEGLLPTREGARAGEVEIPKMYEALMERFWPGALSLVFPLAHLDPKGKGKAVEPAAAAPPFAFTPSSTASTTLPAPTAPPPAKYTPPRLSVAPEVTAGQPSLCIRMPSHPLALRLIQHSNLPLAAPSANLSSRPSPTTAAHVLHDLGEGRGVGAVLDGGECDVGVESTVVDWVPPKEGEEGEGALRILRAGGVTAEEIEACLRDAGFATSSSGEGERKKVLQVYARDFRSKALEAAPTTPGMKYKHYAPGNAKVVLVRPIAADEAGPLGPLPSLQYLIQLTALTHASVGVDAEGNSVEERFRVGLMLMDETVEALKAEVVVPSTSTSTDKEEKPAPTAAYETLTLPPPPPSLFSTLSLGEESNLPPLSRITILSHSLGSRARPIEAAQRLFGGLRLFDSLPLSAGAGAEKEGERVGVDLILVEAVPEEGVGLAVMERARKAAGGTERGGEMEFALP